MDPADLLTLIAGRRSSNMIRRDTAVDIAVIDELITAAQWAPNHKRTWPARFCLVSGDSRLSLGNAIADAMEAHGDDAPKVEKTRTKYARAPWVIIVAAAAGTSDSETEENRYSVAAGIQNLLLQAHARGLAALWGSPAKGANEAITAFAGMDPTDHVIGLVYVGVPSHDAPHVDRPAPRVTRRG